MSSAQDCREDKQSATLAATTVSTGITSTARHLSASASTDLWRYINVLLLLFLLLKTLYLRA